MHRLSLLFFSSAFVSLGLLSCLRAEEPKPLTDAQKARLRERDGVKARIDPLLREGRLDAALKAAEKALAVERDVRGPEHFEPLDTLRRIARLHEWRDDLAAAAAAWKEVRKLATKSHGADSWRATDIDRELAWLERLGKMSKEDRTRLRDAALALHRAEHLAAAGQVEEALKLARQGVDARRALLPARHLLQADAQDTLGQVHQVRGEFEQAARALAAARALRVQLLGRKHPLVAKSLSNLGNLLREAGEMADARKLLEAACALHRELGLADHPDHAIMVCNLGLALQAQGDFPGALKCFEQARGLRKKWLADDDLLHAADLICLAELHREWGDLRQALALHRECRAFFRKQKLEGHAYHATCLNNLCLTLTALGDYPAALKHSEQAMALREKLLGKEHHLYAADLNNRAEIYRNMGDLRTALVLQEGCEEVLKKVKMEGHPAYAVCLNNQGLIHQALGDHLRALRLFEEARALHKKQVGEGHPTYAADLNNVAQLYRDAGEPKKALPYQEQARAIFVRLGMTKSPQYAVVLCNLGLIYHELGEFDKAAEHYEKARELRRKLFKDEHVDCIGDLHNLALLHRDRGEHKKALALFEQASALARKLHQDRTTRYPILLINAAIVCHFEGKREEAVRLAREGLMVARELLEGTFTVQGDQQRMMLVLAMRHLLHVYLTVTAEGDVPAAQRYEPVLAWKGLVAARRAEEAAARGRAELAPVVEELRLVRGNLARLARTSPEPGRLRDWVRQFDKLEADRDRLDAQLARESAAYRRFRAAHRATPAEVAAALPAGTVLIDYVAYGHYGPPSGPERPIRLEGRLLAFVLAPSREPVCVSLGPLDELEKQVQAWRKAVVEGGNANKPGAELARRLWQPLRKHLGGAKAVRIAGDGPLTGLPFGALPGEKPGTYLLEEVAIGYVTAGRQLLEPAAEGERQPSTGLLVVGDPDYGAPPAKARTVWTALPGTRLEADHVADTFRGAFPRGRTPEVLTGVRADPDHFRQALASGESPRWRHIHVATHGFFEQGGAALQAGGDPLRVPQEYRLHVRNPLLLSGLVLAGANRGGGQGILTAEEVSGFDLSGTELVVLSACDTGLGAVAHGEGVLGLQRAFQAAGARTLVTTLWSVDDAAAAVLMEEFYANLWQKKLSRLEALRQAQLTVLKNPDRVERRRKELGEEAVRRGIKLGASKPLPRGEKRSHPALWAAFVLSGDGR